MANESMANEVYLLTHDGLSQMVSSRVATRFLDRALDAKGYSADSVSSEEMRDILQGPILRELRQILPKDGVERSIKQISRNLKKQAEKVAEAALAVANASASDGFKSSSHLPMVSGNVLLTNDDDELTSPEQVLNFAEATDDLGVIQHSSPLEDKQAFDTSEVEAALATVLDTTVLDAAPEENTPAVSPNVNKEVEQPETPAANPVKPNPLKAEHSPEDLAKMLVKFAQLENVKLVAAVRPNGEVSMARGSGLDVDALSRLGSLGLKLLSRGRTIRSYYLSNSRYQLFLFPLASHTLIVVGSSEVNVGEVFNTRSQLESQLEEEV
jgi:hypothetical protein